MTRRLGSLLVTVLLAAQTLPLDAEEAQRYLIAPRNPGVNASRLRVATSALKAPRYRVQAFEHLDAFAANLTASEAAEWSRSGDYIVEPVVPRYAEGSLEGLQPLDARVTASTQQIPWGIAAVHAPDVWRVTTGANVNVVVVDTGIETDHPDLAHAYAGGHNTFKPDAPPVDNHRHGTHVAGTVAAANNDIGVVGVAPGVKVWAIKALGDDGEGTSESVIASFDWTIRKAKELGGRWVMNLSLGSTLYSEIEERAVSDAVGEGIVVVAAAGNLGMELVKYPGAHPHAIAVGAVDETLTRAKFSGFGRGLKLMGPGAAIRSTIIRGYDFKIGVTGSAGTAYPAWRVIGSPFTSVTGRVYDCGDGDPEDFPAGVRGNVAWIRRGKYKFREMARNAKEAGAAAFIVQNYATDSSTNDWTFYPDPPDPAWDGYAYPLAVGMRHETAAALLESGEEVTLSYTTELSGVMNGTSMASPHVAATVALLLSLDPTLSVAEVQYILRVTARDLETAGWNPETGYGLVDALKAAHWVAPEKFDVPPPPRPKIGRRRSAR